MYVQCREYLVEKLREAGVKSKPHTTRKSLSNTQEGHLAAVLFESETVERDGSKQLFKDKMGAQNKRRCLFTRKLRFTVVIGDYNEDAISAIYERFLSSLDRGLLLDGNFIELTPEATDWVDVDDSILRAKLSTQTVITFSGGIYRDTGFATVRDVELMSIDKE